MTHNMKTFIIHETVPVVQYRTIAIEAENEEEAVNKYLNNPDLNFDIDITEEFDWNGSRIVGVEEEE
jgi:hypothetical protein